MNKIILFLLLGLSISSSIEAMEEKEPKEKEKMGEAQRSSSSSEATVQLPQVDEGWICSICREGENAIGSDGRVKRITKGQTQFGCTHRFHLICLNQWKKNKDDCPVCRARKQNVSTSENSLSMSSLLEALNSEDDISKSDEESNSDDSAPDSSIEGEGGYLDGASDTEREDWQSYMENLSEHRD